MAKIDFKGNGSKGVESSKNKAHKSGGRPSKGKTPSFNYPAPKFKAGDVCILINAENHLELNGQTVTVIENLGWRVCSGEQFFGYLLDIRYQGHQIVAKPHQLKKKPLPKNFKKTVSWDSVGWSPHKEVAQSLEGVSHDR